MDPKIKHFDLEKSRRFLVSSRTENRTSQSPLGLRLQGLRTDFTDYLTVHQLSLLNVFTFVSVFFRFLFSKSFSSSVIFSSLLLSTPIYPTIGLFLGESASLSSFFQFFVFHKLLILMH